MSAAPKKSGGHGKQAAGRSKAEQKFKAALAEAEELGKAWVEESQNPSGTGIKIARELTKLADMFQAEAEDDSVTGTEASYVSNATLGVGI